MEQVIGAHLIEYQRSLDSSIELVTLTATTIVANVHTSTYLPLELDRFNYFFESFGPVVVANPLVGRKPSWY
jgi:hypothetical protein